MDQHSSEIRPRVENPARWQSALARAEAEGIRVCQVQGTGQWIATSGTTAGAAYALAVTGNVAHGCDCLAGMNGDPVCKHRAAFYLLIGALVRPERSVDCPDCNGCGVHYDKGLERAGLLYPTCAACGGSGLVDAPVLHSAA
jgi:hypothetical protein